MVDQHRRRLLLAAGTLSTALAGCANIGPGTDQESTTGGMDGGMTTTDGMDDTTTDSMDDGMTTTEPMDDTTGSMATEFTVTVENVSTADTLQTMEGSTAVPLSPLAYAVHGEDGALFAAGEAASAGLEALAEDGAPSALAEEAAMQAENAGTVAVPESGGDARPIGPGESYAFTVEASHGQRLSLATMFVQSNDLFYAPDPGGIPLFEDGKPAEGDVTDSLVLWDAGTEVNEEPGAGPNQAPRQSGPDTGPEQDLAVRRIEDRMDGHDYPDTAAVVAVTLSPGGMGMDG